MEAPQPHLSKKSSVLHTQAPTPIVKPIAYTSPNAASQSSSEPDPSTPQILVIEDGYEHSQLLFEPGADLNRYLKAAFKRELPRSHQAYLVEKK